jgi:hypothetical protein
VQRGVSGTLLNLSANKRSHIYRDILCGMLHCTHRNDQLEFGLEATSILSHAFLSVNGSIKACKSAIIDLGLDQADPGMVPNGAKCGESKVSLEQDKLFPLIYMIL